MSIWKFPIVIEEILVFLPYNHRELSIPRHRFRFPSLFSHYIALFKAFVQIEYKESPPLKEGFKIQCNTICDSSLLYLIVWHQ